MNQEYTYKIKSVSKMIIKVKDAKSKLPEIEHLIKRNISTCIFKKYAPDTNFINSLKLDFKIWKYKKKLKRLPEIKVKLENCEESLNLLLDKLTKNI